MTTQEFWNKYINGRILDIFDDTYEFFADGLPQDFLDGYDADEVILETLGHNFEAKEFDRVFKFSDMLKQKYPDLYMQNFPYIDRNYIEYYCFKQEYEKAVDAFSNFVQHPTDNYDGYLDLLELLSYYGCNKLIEEAVTFKTIETVAGDQSLIFSAGEALVGMMFMTLVEKYYDAGTFDEKGFSEIKALDGFTYKDTYLLAIEENLFSPLPEKLPYDNDEEDYFLIELSFLKYAKTKHIHFPAAHRIWEQMVAYWDKENKQGREKFFSFNKKSFEKYVTRMLNAAFSDETYSMIAFVWGSVYIYDFLKKMDLISKVEYDLFLSGIRQIKGILIYYDLPNFWKGHFIHTWGIPDSIPASEFEQESKLFAKGFNLKPMPFKEWEPLLAGELEAMGELAAYIKEEKDHDYDDADDDDTNTYTEPYIAPKQPGRNDPCPCGSGKKYKKCCGKG
jgi:hypothetical protein